MTPTLEIAPGLFAHATGALWIPSAGALLIADAHLGYGWAQRRRGELGPLRDDLAAGKIEALLKESEPREIVFLGDMVHAPRPGPGERQLIEELLAALKSRARLTLLRGNHDRAFERDFAPLGIPLVEEWRFENIRAVHGDRPVTHDGAMLVLGHLHPSLSIEDAAGARRRIPVFLVSEQAVILPAFSPFAAGFDVGRGLPRGLLRGEVHAIAATGTRVVRLGPLRAGRLELDRGRKTGRASEWR